MWFCLTIVGVAWACAFTEYARFKYGKKK